MLNLLHDIERAVFRVQSLRARINELTAELHAEETKLAVYTRQCIGALELELHEETTRRTIEGMKGTQ